MRAVEERISDRAVLKLLREILRAGVMQDGNLRRPVTGAAQGGAISPLLCNAYLHRIDRVWSAREHGVLVRFADDGMPRTRLEVAMKKVAPNGRGAALVTEVGRPQSLFRGRLQAAVSCCGE